MRIEFLYSEDCPPLKAALDRLKQVLKEEGLKASIKIVKVETEEQAQDLQFIGSPTIFSRGKGH